MNRLVETLPPPRCRDESVHRGSCTTLVCPLIPTHSSRGWGILPRASWLPGWYPLITLEHAPPTPSWSQEWGCGQGAGLLGDPSCRGVPEGHLAILNGGQGAVG